MPDPDLIPKVSEKTKMLRTEDLMMLIVFNGKKRTIMEMQALLKVADGRYEVDEIYHGVDEETVVSVKLVENGPGIKSSN